MILGWEAKIGPEAPPGPVWALDPEREGRPRPPEAAPDDPEVADDDAPAWVCRRCQARITTRDAAFAMTPAGVVQVFPNPGGWMRKIVTVRWAEGWHPYGGPTTDFTWFAGYAWTIVVCAGCGAHLGWLYEASAAGTPARFFGLLLDALAERG